MIQRTYNYLWDSRTKIQNICKKLHTKKCFNFLIKQFNQQIEKSHVKSVKVLFNKNKNLKLFSAIIFFVINVLIVMLSIKLDSLKKYIVLDKIV